MQNWRYLTVLFRRQRNERGALEWKSFESTTVFAKGATLDDYGSEGWELVSILLEKSGTQEEVIVTAFFKQPIEEE